MNKSKILNIAIIVIALALIIFLVVKEKKSDNDAVVPSDEASENDGTNGTATGGAAIPVPSEASWTERTTETKLSFEVPEEYYISYPVIGGCDEVVSISTQTPTDPTIAVALIYKEGCVTDVDVTGFYAHQEVKNGYVFQTNSNHPTVRAVFDRIVATAEVK